jgi:hypothetical protein
MPLVLVQNERTVGGRYDSWQDSTGRLYHFPNSYRVLVQPGERFVYYRGVRRENGGRRPNPEYFGYGVVEKVWRDPSIDPKAPKRTWKWFCSLSEYIPFISPVSWMKLGKTLEQIPKNLFGNGVRRISDGVLEQILAQAITQLSDETLLGASHAYSARDVTRSQVLLNRVVRDTPLVRMIKELHQNRCQICSLSLTLPGGKRYSEGHHIRPLGEPHNGPDTAENILIVCPNHHVLCDRGGIRLELETLLSHPAHKLGQQHIRYHNEVVYVD